MEPAIVKTELSVCEQCNEYKHAQVPHVCLSWSCPNCHCKGHDVVEAVKHVCNGKFASLSPRITTQALCLLLNRVEYLEKILVDHNIINEKVFQDEAKRSAA